MAEEVPPRRLTRSETLRRDHERSLTDNPSEQDPPTVEPMEVGEGSGAADVDPDPVDHTVSEPDDVLEDNPDSIRETLQKEMDRQLADRFAAMTVEFESRLQVGLAAQPTLAPPPTASTDNLVLALKMAFPSQPPEPRPVVVESTPEPRFNGGRNFVPPEYTPRDAVGPTQWLYHMDLYFEYAKVPESERIISGVMRLRDAATSWWKTHVLSTTNGDGTPTAGRIVTWAEFATGLRKQFTPISEKKIVRGKLYSLKQTGSVQAYTSAFRELQFHLADVSELEAYTLYERGLKPSVQDGIHHHFPQTLEETIAYAEQFDAKHLGSRGSFSYNPEPPRPSGSGKPRYFGKKSPAKLNAARIEIPTDSAEIAVAAMGKQKKKQGGDGRPSSSSGPPNPERQRLRKEGRCFKCEQTGHLIRDCPQGNGNRQ